MPSSKPTYLDKRMAKIICRGIYYCGLGNVWYEPIYQSYLTRFIYRFWCFISYGYMTTVVLGEVAAVANVNLTEKERSDAVLYSFAHSLIILKFAVLHFQRNKIKIIFKKLIEDTRTSFTLQTEAAAVRKAKIYSSVLGGTMMITILLTTIDALKSTIKKGIPLRTLITYWPTRQDTGTLVTTSQVFIQFHWWYLIFVMVLVDSMCFTGLIYLGFKFQSLQLLFKSLRKEVIGNVKAENMSKIEEDFKQKFIGAIKLHNETLWCAQNLQYALGNIYSLQIVQSIGLLSMCLIRLVNTERSFTLFLANAAFICCMLTLTGTYMMAAGDITYQAGLVSTAIFYSGWELCQSQHQLLPLLVMAIQRSQMPVIMTAFGIFDLSYRNFISVLRTSYSFFAVLY